MAWDYKRYGSANDPIHKSHLNDLTGDWGCPTRFRYARDEASRGGPGYDLDRPVRGDAACGTAAHETIARALNNPELRAHLLTGRSDNAVPGAMVRRAFEDELAREIGERRVEWYDATRDDVVDDRVAMVTGVLNDLHRYVAEVVLVEPAFVFKLGTHWVQGHIDLVFRPRSAPTTLAITDWKTGAMRPDPIDLDHGWEAGIYSNALKSGHFLPRESLVVEYDRDAHVWRASCGMFTTEHPSKYIAERTCAERVLTGVACALEVKGEVSAIGPLRVFDEYPSCIYHTHLGDYVPYKRAGKKNVKRPEDLAFYQRSTAGDVKYIAGQQRGPAWLPVRMTEHDRPRVEHRVRNVVGMVRMGRFIDQVGDRCKRCPYAEDCLNTGYGLRGDARAQLERDLKGVDVSAAEDLSD